MTCQASCLLLKGRHDHAEASFSSLLQVGDVLFMPRGTVHQAVAQEAASCHVTISTYQKWALADFAVALLQVAICHTDLSRPHASAPEVIRALQPA